jgi:hypothetical protein
LQYVLEHPDPFRLQIIYTQIDRDAYNNPALTYYQYGLDNGRYFYPASTVKLPIALLALEWIAEQDVAGLNASTIMLTDAATDWQTAQTTDLSSPTALPSIAHYIKKILLVSDNDASNRLYELLGQDFINQRMLAKGLTHSVINHRLSLSLTAEQNRQFNPIRFVGEKGETVLTLPARSTNNRNLNAAKPTIGKGYIKDNASLVHRWNLLTKIALALQTSTV